jgi:hypothetical protein
MRLREMGILIAILAAILILGFTVNVGSFADNLLASAADIIVGIFIAFYLIDWISRREKTRRWERVKILTYHSIESSCDRIMFAFQTETDISWEANPYTQEAMDAPEQNPQYKSFLKLGEEVARRVDELSHMNPIVVDPQMRHSNLPGHISVSETREGVTIVPDKRHADQLRHEQLHGISSQYLLRAVTPHFEKLSLNIFPRIFELGEQEELASSFIAAESAFQDWETNVDTIEGDWGMPEHYAWDAAAQFCTRIGEMLKVIYLAERESA